MSIRGLPNANYVEAFHGERENCEDSDDRSLPGDKWKPNLRYRPLGETGMDVSTVSYGGSALGGFYGDVGRQEAVDTIRESIKCGINFLDTSPWYGESESIIGEALVGVPRQAYYIGTKVGRNFTPDWDGRFDFSYSAVLKNVETSLERLRLPFVDIIQVHDAEFCHDFNILINETIPALESVVKAGKARFIGITGYDLTLLKQIIEKVPAGQISTVLSYARYNFHDDSLYDSTQFFAQNKIGIINAAPLAMGLLSSQGPPAWHAASDETKEAARIAAELAAASGSTLETASLQYSLHPPEPIATTLVSIPNKNILETNLKIATLFPHEIDRTLHQKILTTFKSRNAGHWEGVEVEDYRKWLSDKK